MKNAMKKVRKVPFCQTPSSFIWYSDKKDYICSPLQKAWEPYPSLRTAGAYGGGYAAMFNLNTLKNAWINRQKNRNDIRIRCGREEYPMHRH